MCSKLVNLLIIWAMADRCLPELLYNIVFQGWGEIIQVFREGMASPGRYPSKV